MSYEFVNPFNFVPLSKEAPNREAVATDEKLSGVIRYAVRTITPLFIPNTSSDQAFEVEGCSKDHKSYDFFSYHDLEEGRSKELPLPVIPGSEMRGMIRHHYEILTNSCLSSIDRKAVLSKRTHDVFSKGKLKKRIQAGKVVYDLYDVDDRLVTENINLRSLEEVLRIYAIGKYHLKYQKDYNAFKKNRNEQTFPVRYSVLTLDKGEKVYYLSPAAITREVYQKQMEDMLGEHAPCDERNKLCPGCRLFGTLETGHGTFQNVSRLRFSDLRMRSEDEDVFENIATIKELGVPKMSNMEFYFEKPKKAVFWTPDYYIDASGNIHTNPLGINGRKFYWHNMNPLSYTADRATDHNITVRMLKPGIEFEGRLYFKDISKEELHQLIYLLNCGDIKQSLSSKKHGYKLGAAKPLGLGSTAVDVENVQIRTLVKDDEEHRIHYVVSDYNEYEKPMINPTIEGQFRKLTSFHAMDGENLDYPRLVEDGKIHEWFMTENHRAYRFNKEGEAENIGAPSKRRQEYFAHYLKPMEAKLSDIPLSIFRGPKGENIKTSAPAKPEGPVIKATVRSMDDYHNIYFRQSKDIPMGARIRNYQGRVGLEVGDKIEVRFVEEYKSKSGRVHYNYDFVRKL